MVLLGQVSVIIKLTDGSGPLSPNCMVRSPAVTLFTSAGLTLTVTVAALFCAAVADVFGLERYPRAWVQ